MTPEELYKCVTALSKGVTHHIREELKTELLLHGLKLYQQYDDGYVFVSLVHRKIDVIRAYKKRIKFVYDTDLVTEHVEESYPIGDSVRAVFDVYFHVTKPYQRLLLNIVKNILDGGDSNLTNAIRDTGISKRRGFHLVKVIREQAKEALDRRRKSGLSELREAETLYECFQRDVNS